MPDIESLRLIWWILLGILLIGFAIMDGFDLGAAVLFPFITRDETERRIVLNAIGPIWEGNQVWIILGAGAIFAAWPYVYAVAFSMLYYLILLLLLTMGISRPVSFKYRSKLPNLFWKRTWDKIVFIGGFVPAILFGILVGNIILGLPFYFDESLRVVNQAHFLQFFNPFALLCGLLSLCMLCMHGGLFISIKTESPIRERAIGYSRFASLLLIFLFALAGIWVQFYIHGYQVVSVINTESASNPLHKEVIQQIGAWMNNYKQEPQLFIVPTLGFLGAICAFIVAGWNNRLAFLYSSVSIIGIIGTFGVSLFPFILPSSSNPSASLLVWDASSSQLTLLIMLAGVIIFLPIILIYTAWVYRVMRGPVTRDRVESGEEHTVY